MGFYDILSWNILRTAYKDVKDPLFILNLGIRETGTGDKREIGFIFDRGDKEMIGKIYNDLIKVVDGKEIKRGKWATDLIRKEKKENSYIS